MFESLIIRNLFIINTILRVPWIFVDFILIHIDRCFKNKLDITHKILLKEVEFPIFFSTLL